MPSLLKPLGLVTLLAATLPVQAHKLWLLPSHTAVSEPQWITVDASISNEIFGFERAYPVDGVTVTGPDGNLVEVDNATRMHTRSVFDVQLEQEGSYRVAVAQPGFFLMYEVDGERKRARGNDAEKMLKALPDNATNVKLTESFNRLETVVTQGAPNTTGLKPTGKGLEIEFLTHPNDLYAGETAKWRLLVDGKPARDLKVELVPGGTRYRDSQQDWSVTSDKKGMVEITWPNAGRYFLEVSTSDDKSNHKKANERRLGYIATVEVLPM
ncbi:MAG: DUF4198 domain-containing protein [Alcanivorax nanhaiticus]